MNDEMRKKMKAEACDRMKKLGIMGKIKEEFRRSNRVNVSVAGILYWADDEQMKAIKEVEDEYDCIVYHAIESKTEFGDLLSCLIVTASEMGDDEESRMELKQTREMLADGYVFSYVINKTYPEFSELGDIVVRPQYGGLVRTA